MAYQIPCDYDEKNYCVEILKDTLYFCVFTDLLIRKLKYNKLMWNI